MSKRPEVLDFAVFRIRRWGFGREAKGGSARIEEIADGRRSSTDARDQPAELTTVSEKDMYPFSMTYTLYVFEDFGSTMERSGKGRSSMIHRALAGVA